MTPRATALVAVLGFTLATGALTAVNVARQPVGGVPDAGARPAPERWVPHWLTESLQRAIADATDPHERR